MGFPYTNEYMVRTALKKVYAAPMAGGEATPLFKQEEDTGYFFPSADPISPDGRYIAIFRMKDGRVEPGIYDLRRSRVQFLEIAAEFRYIFPHITWISDEEFIFSPSREAGSSDSDVRAARELAAAREKGWNDGEVTAEVLGAGKYERPQSLLAQKLTSVNARTGKTKDLISGYRLKPMLMVGRPEQAVLSEAVFDVEPVKEEGRTTPPRVLWTMNILTGEKTPVDAFNATRERPRAWSDSGKYLLIGHRTYHRGRAHGEAAFILDVEASEIVERLPVGASNFVWVGDRLLYTPGEEDVSLGRPADGDAIAMLITGAAPITASGEYYYYLEEGDLWRATLGGAKENLTLDYPNSIEQYQHPSISGLAPSRKSTWQLTPAPHEIRFETEIDGRRTLIMLARDGEEIRHIPFPRQGSKVAAATPDGAVFVTNVYGVGSMLEYVPTENKPYSLYRFNRHMADITPAAGPIRIDHKGYDGRDVNSWLYLPPGASVGESEPYPLVVVSYPELIYDKQPPSRDYGYAASIWDLNLITNATMEMYAAQGYAVLLPSVPLAPWGEPGEPMTRMMPAILSVVDGAIETGFADSDRMALVGQSFGGYGALSVAVQTDRFRAIIAMAPSANMTSMYGQFAPRAKVNGSMLDTWTKGPAVIADRQGRTGAPPWGDADRYIRNSPLFHVDDVQSPVMLIHGDLDTAVNISQSEEMFTSLFKEGKDVLFVKYFGEQHTIEQPQNQRDMWRRIFSFLTENGVGSE